MAYFFTADLHLGHKNCISYCNRPFRSVEEMDSEIIRRWNEAVGEKDIIYVLGDFTLSSPKIAQTYISKLKGEKHFLPGSHDYWITKQLNNDYTIDPPIVKLKTVLDKPLILCHYAMRTWDTSHYGSYHLYGHSHGQLESYGLSFDVGVDTHDFYPWSVTEIQNKMNNLQPIVDYSKRK